MFDRAPNPPEKIATTSQPETTKFDALDKKYAKKLEKKYKRRYTLPIKLGTTVLAISSVTNAYWADVAANRAEQAAADVSINVIGEPIDADNAHKATLLIDGFNAYDADYLTKKIGPSVQQVADGELWSLSYNNAILNREKIYESIVQMVEDHNIENLTIAGYSMGGVIATEAASDIVTKSSTEVDSLILMHTPDGYDGLRDYQKKELGISEWIARWVPGAIDSSWVRFIGELYFYRDDYTEGELKEWWDIIHNSDVVFSNIENFITTFGSVSERFNEPKRTSMQLLSEQVFKIVHSDIKKEFEVMAEQRGEKQMPVAMYLDIGKPGYDYMVKGQLSSHNIEEYSEETGIQFSSHLVPGAIHSQYYRTIDEYTRVFTEASESVKLDVQAEAAKHAFYLYTKEQIKDQEQLELEALNQQETGSVRSGYVE
jgi:hypothetical protein